MNNRPFLKLYRDRRDLLASLLADPPALAIYMYVALNAERTVQGIGPNGLHVGQCWMPPPATFALTHKAIRCAKERLAAMGLVTFAAQGRKGTIATLTGDQVADINPMQLDENGQYLLEFLPENRGQGVMQNGAKAGAKAGAKGACAESEPTTTGYDASEDARGQGRGQGKGQARAKAGANHTFKEDKRSKESIINPPPEKRPGGEGQGADDDDSLVEDLAAMGLGRDAIEGVLAEYPAEIIRQGLAIVETKLEDAEPIANPAGYLLTTLANGIVPAAPKAEEAKERQQARQRRHLEAERRIRERQEAQAAEARRQSELVDRMRQERPDIVAMFEADMAEANDFAGMLWREGARWDHQTIRAVFWERVKNLQPEGVTR